MCHNILCEFANVHIPCICMLYEVYVYVCVFVCANDFICLNCGYVSDMVVENAAHNCVEFIVTVVVVVVKMSSFVTLPDTLVLFYACKFYTIFSYSHIRHLILVKVVLTYLWAFGFLNYLLNSQFFFVFGFCVAKLIPYIAIHFSCICNFDFVFN